MSWRFRKSFKLLPGVRLNVSRSGISTTIGGAPFSVNVGPRGVYSNTSIPGTGIFARERLGAPAYGAPGPSVERPPAPRDVARPVAAPTALPPMQEIRSGSTEGITSRGLAEFRSLVMQAEAERADLAREIASANREASAATARYRNWTDGWLMRRLRPARFADLGRIAEESSARFSELEEQMALAQLATVIELPTECAESFHRLCDTFATMAAATRIWDTLASRAANQRVERTIASAVITREPVTFALGQSDLLRCEWRVPHLENRNGGDLFLYPGFVLYRVSREAFAVIASRDVSVEYASCGFHEVEAIPPDTEVIGNTWTKANKDGSPDKRFRDNRQIPVVRYGQLTITSDSGLHEVYLVSHSASAEQFAAAWAAHRRDLRA